jgi:hypothetical protein
MQKPPRRSFQLDDFVFLFRRLDSEEAGVAPDQSPCD